MKPRHKAKIIPNEVRRSRVIFSNILASKKNFQRSLKAAMKSGLLATLVFRLRGIEVVTFGRTPNRTLTLTWSKSWVRNIFRRPISLFRITPRKTVHSIIFEATGFSPIVFDAMQALAKNGVLVLSSVTGGDKIIVSFILLIGQRSCRRADWLTHRRQLRHVSVDDLHRHRKSRPIVLRQPVPQYNTAIRDVPGQDVFKLRQSVPGVATLYYRSKADAWLQFRKEFQFTVFSPFLTTL